MKKLPLAASRNLGQKSAEQLALVGILTLEDLKREGVVETYVQLKEMNPRTSLVFLWALFGALEDCDFREVPPEVKAYLRKEVAKKMGKKGRLENLKNIGKRVAFSLREIGICTQDELREVGVISAWKRLRKKNPKKNICVCTLYALYGALKDVKWNEIPEKKKREFQQVSRDFREEKRKPILLDLRTPREIAEGKICPLAREIDFFSPDFQEQINSLSREKSYLIYCRSGKRSGKTLKMMKEMGFLDVDHIEKGIEGFQK